MSQDILQILSEKPEEVYDLSTKKDTAEYFAQLVKSLLDPITKSHSVLDEIYVDGLDASQVYGQTKMVLEGVGESLLFEKIPELKQTYGVKDGSISDEEDEEEEDDEEVNASEEEDINTQLSNEEDEEEEDEDDDEEEEFQSAEENYEDSEAEQQEQEVSDDEATIVPSDNEGDADVAPEPKKDVFGLNDGFFDIDEFNRQSLALENDDEEDNEDDDEEIDFFADLSGDDDDEDENMAYFDDFYEKPGAPNGQTKTTKPEKSNGDDQDEEEEEEEDFEFDDNEYENAMGSAMLDLFDDEEPAPKSTANLSSFEKQQRQIQDEIATLEAELIAEKKWSMKGEVSAKDRPEDSLLDDNESHNLEFERTSKPVPVITQEVTESLEDMIRRRIKEDNFDDLPKRLITDVASFHNKQKFELSETKSSKSLAEIYEGEYKGEGNIVEQQQKEVSEELQKQHDEISELFAKVTHKLDSLCSAHFIPKPHQFKQVEIKVTDSGASAAASISMEDAQPLHVSGDTALAPQEVYKVGDDKPKNVGREGKREVQLKSGLSYSKDELSRDDKQRLRRAAKRKRSKEFNQRKELNEQKEKQQQSKGGERKRAKVGEVIDTLSRAKNVTVIGKKGDLTDVKGHLKKKEGPKGSSGFKL